MKLQDVVLELTSVQESECLIEGTMKDKISHFVLRLACCQNPEMASFFLKMETALFDWRFSCMSEEEMCKLLKSIDQYISMDTCRHGNNLDKKDQVKEILEKIKDLLNIFSKIKQASGKWRKAVRNYLNGDVSEHFSVPFHYVLGLVKRREVYLSYGIARVPFCHLRTVVTYLYGRMLYAGILTASDSFHTEDERILDLIKTVKVIFKQRYQHRAVPLCRNPHPVSNRDVDRLAEYFPLCMSHALWSLRRKHRLGHHTRIQLTLFLKEVGLPVHEALVFWKDEYSKPPCHHGNSCSHDWIHNERRYIYNIRHLYGLEGSRTNYRSHSCCYLQEEFQGHKEEGGCPFSHFDLENLTNVMATAGFHGNSENILKLTSDGKCSLACKAYMKENLQRQQTKGTPQVCKTEVTLHNLKDSKYENRVNNLCDVNTAARPASSYESTDKPTNDITSLLDHKDDYGCFVRNPLCYSVRDTCKQDINENMETHYESNNNSNAINSDKETLKHTTESETCDSTQDVNQNTETHGESNIYSNTSNNNAASIKHTSKHCSCDSKQDIGQSIGTISADSIIFTNTCNSNGCLLKTVKIHYSKPVDYYTSYRNLLENLQNLKT